VAPTSNVPSIANIVIAFHRMLMAILDTSLPLSTLLVFRPFAGFTKLYSMDTHNRESSQVTALRRSREDFFIGGEILVAEKLEYMHPRHLLRHEFWRGKVLEIWMAYLVWEVGTRAAKSSQARERRLDATQMRMRNLLSFAGLWVVG
jgi:hypothetical protein